MDSQRWGRGIKFNSLEQDRNILQLNQELTFK